MLALSVSTSTSGSPRFTGSPRATSQRSTTPSSMESERRGIVISTGTGGSWAARLQTIAVAASFYETAPRIKYEEDDQVARAKTGPEAAQEGPAEEQAGLVADQVAAENPVKEQESSAAAPTEDDPQEMLSLYSRILLTREFEGEIHRLFLKGEVHGTTHLSSGQEAIPVGFCSTLDPGDYIAGTYRGHGHALAKGTDPEQLAAEMLGRASGVCGGRAGSMNVIDLPNGLVGCFGIVGGSIAAATGAAVSAKRQGKVAAAFFGDGATNQGYFHECLNFAKVLDLPIVFVCENNFYGEFTPMAAVTAGGSITARAAAVAIPSAMVDGNHLL